MLTPKQKKVLDYIEKYQLNHGSSPTLREMKEFLKVSSDNSILKHLKALEQKNFIQKDHTPRGIKLLKSVKQRLEFPDIKLPLLGTIPAGGPTMCEENVETWVSVAENIVKYPNDSFLLRVIGDSMIDAGIQEGDIVVVHAQDVPHNNDIVAALIDQENTIKRYIFNGQKAYLKAENQQYPNIYPVNELVIQGVVTGLIRNY